MGLNLALLSSRATLPPRTPHNPPHHLPSLGDKINYKRFCFCSLR